eukprot:845905-Rhodomonas_salina.1
MGVYKSPKRRLTCIKTCNFRLSLPPQVQHALQDLWGSFQPLHYYLTCPLMVLLAPGLRGVGGALLQPSQGESGRHARTHRHCDTCYPHMGRAKRHWHWALSQALFDYRFYTAFPSELWQIFFCSATGAPHPECTVAQHIDWKCKLLTAA